MFILEAILAAQGGSSLSKIQAESCLTLSVDLSGRQGALSPLATAQPSCFPQVLCPESDFSTIPSFPQRQGQPHDVTLGYFQKTHFSLSWQGYSTPALSRWVSGDIPAFSHSYLSVPVRISCLFPRVPV